MIPGDSEELPVGSDREVVRKVQEAMDASPRQGGIVSLIEGEEDRRLQCIGNVPWTGSPMFVVLRYFGLPFTADAYNRVIRSVREEERGDLFVRDEGDHVPGDAPIKAAIVQTVQGWGLAEAEQFLTAHKH